MKLIIDTSTKNQYFVLVNGENSNELNNVVPKNHAEVITPDFKDFMEINSFGADITEIILVNGPGSYTGVRVGVTLAKTLGWTLDIQSSQISSLMAQASGYTGVVAVMLDARRQNCFGAIYRIENDTVTTISEDGFYSFEHVISLTNDQTLFTWTAIEKTPEVFEDKITTVEYKVDNFLVSKYARKLESPHLLNPVYHKRTEAEENYNG